MGHKDIPYDSKMAPKGCEWEVTYRHWGNEGTALYSVLIFNYEKGLTAYEAWHKCNNNWPDKLTSKGICPAFHECVTYQLSPFPYPTEKEKKPAIAGRESGEKTLIPVLDLYKKDTLVSESGIFKNDNETN